MINIKNIARTLNWIKCQKHGLKKELNGMFNCMLSLALILVLSLIVSLMRMLSLALICVV